MTHRPIGPATVTVNGSHWPATYAWGGLHFDAAEIRLTVRPEDYYLRVPWLHPEDAHRGSDPDVWAFYHVRPKRDGDRFVRVDGMWMVEKGKRG